MSNLTVPFIPERYQRTSRKFLESLNTGLMNIYENQAYEEESGITKFKFVQTYKDIPCRLSFQDKQTATRNEPAIADKDVHVITVPEFFIPSGAIIEITFGGVTNKYKQAGRTHHNDFRNSTPLVLYEEHVVSKEYDGVYEFKN